MFEDQSQPPIGCSLPSKLQRLSDDNDFQAFAHCTEGSESAIVATNSVTKTEIERLRKELEMARALALSAKQTALAHMLATTNQFHLVANESKAAEERAVGRQGIAASANAVRDRVTSGIGNQNGTLLYRS